MLAGLAVLGLTGAAAAALAYGLFRAFAQGWLKAQFDRDLEVFRAAKSRELETLKGEISRLMDRATKFHAREYEVLPEAWGLLNRAYGAVGEVVSVLQRHPDLEKMQPDELEEFFGFSELRESQKQKLRAASQRKRNELYSTIRNWQMIGRANDAVATYQNYIILNGVFIADEIGVKMLDAAKKLRSATAKRQIAGDGPDPSDLWTKAYEELQAIEPLVSEIKADVTKRLWDIQLQPSG